MHGNSPESEWTIETLRQHVEKLLEHGQLRERERFEAQKEATRLALEAQKEATRLALDTARQAVDKAEVASNKRFEGVNEFRQTLSDQQRTLMPRNEAELQFGRIREELQLLREQDMKRISQGLGLQHGWSILIAALGAIGIIVGIVAAFKH
jgi:hypothetical protein